MAHYTLCRFEKTWDEAMAKWRADGCPLRREKDYLRYALPNPKTQPHIFEDCEIHPRLWSCIRQQYSKSRFINTYIGPKYE